MNLTDFQALQEQVEQLKAEKARKEGELAGIRKRLRQEFKVKSVGEGKRLLAKMNKELERAEAEFERELKAFRKTHGKHLED